MNGETSTRSAKTPARRRVSRFWLIALPVCAALAIAGYGFTRTPLYATLTHTSLIYSQSALLSETWSTYKAGFVESGSGRTLDSHTTNITSSRGQADTMLRAVYSDDKQTFDSAWTWSRTTDQLPSGLFASQYGPRTGGSYGIMTEQTDSAADTNTALALLMAYSRWNNPQDLTDAKTIINALYTDSVVTVNGSPLMAASSDNAGTLITVNPAAFNGAAFKEFAKVDPSHDWTGLVNNTYATYGTLLAQYGNRLPNSVTIDRDTAAASAAQTDQVFGPNAATAVWNLGFDYGWNHDTRALALMKQLPYAAEYARTNTILTAGTESAATYGKLMPYLRAVAPTEATSVASHKLTNLYNQDQQSWTTRLSITDETWVWNGIAYYNGALRQLTEIR